MQNTEICYGDVRHRIQRQRSLSLQALGRLYFCVIFRPVRRMDHSDRENSNTECFVVPHYYNRYRSSQIIMLPFVMNNDCPGNFWFRLFIDLSVLNSTFVWFCEYINKRCPGLVVATGLRCLSLFATTTTISLSLTSCLLTDRLQNTWRIKLRSHHSRRCVAQRGAARYAVASFFCRNANVWAIVARSMPQCAAAYVAWSKS